MKRCLVISMFALLAVSGVAHGTSIAFHFQGQMNSVAPELLGQFATGQIITGVFGFNSETEDRSDNPGRGLYIDALGFGHLNVESGDQDPDYLAQILEGDILVFDGLSPGDVYRVSVLFQDIVGPAVNGWELIGFEIQLVDPDALAFDSDQLPLLPPDLADFAGNSFLRLIFGRPDTAHAPQVTVHSWPRTAGARFFISEPSTLALLGLGLLGLGLTRRTL